MKLKFSLVFILIFILIEIIILFFLNQQKLSKLNINTKTKKVIDRNNEKTIGKENLNDNNLTSDLYGVYVVLDSFTYENNNNFYFVSGRVKSIYKAEDFDDINSIVKEGELIYFPYVIFQGDSNLYLSAKVISNLQDCNFVNNNNYDSKNIHLTKLTFEEFVKKISKKTIKIRLLKNKKSGNYVHLVRNKYNHFVGDIIFLCIS